MNRAWLWSAFALAWTAACGGKAIVDPIGTGGSGGDPSSSTSSTSTSTSSTSSVGGATTTTTTTGVGGAPPQCFDDTDCTVVGLCLQGICDNGICVAAPLPDGSFCDDDLFCNPPGTCQNGACLPSGTACPIIAPGCQMMTCDEANDACVLVPDDGSPCDDGNPCSGDGVCMGGGCVPGPIDCSALDTACTVGVCAANGCTDAPANEGGPCDDGDPCTSGDACTMGTCTGVPSAITYFAESFADNAAGWTLGPEWEIGPAMVSTGHVFGNPDPGTDHSPSGPDGVAGIAIGGNKSIQMDHDFFWLESPPFDTTIDPGPVVLTFWRWLNSDWTPWMNNRVEVFDGTSWVQLWESGTAPGIEDAAWTEQTFDLTPFKNSAMRIRFGVAVGQAAGAFQVSSWNVDDVLVANAACP